MPDARGARRRGWFAIPVIIIAVAACAPTPTPVIIEVTETPRASVRADAATATPFPAQVIPAGPAQIETRPTATLVASPTATPVAISNAATRQAPAQTPTPPTPRPSVAAGAAGAPTRSAEPAGSSVPVTMGAPVAVTVAAPTVPVPDVPPGRRMVALVFGQSNAGNYGDVRHTAGARVVVLRYGRVTAAADPLRGAQGEGGSVWSRLGDRVVSAGWYDEVVLVPVSFGGTEIAKWVPEMPLFAQISGAADDVRERGWSFTHLLWHQGESDNANHIGWADYQLRFRAMLRGIRELGVSAPIFVSVASRCGVYGPNPVIQGAQMNLVNHDQGIWAGPNTDRLGDEFRVDGCHLNSRGQDIAAADWLDAIQRYELSQGRVPVPRP